MDVVEKDGEARSKESRTYVETNSGRILVPREARHWTVPFQATNMTYPHIAINLNHHHLQQRDSRSRSRWMRCGAEGLSSDTVDQALVAHVF